MSIAHAFPSGHRICDGLDAIPLTGHTLGFTAYKLTTQALTFLFTGDFLSPTAKGWIANVYKLLMPVGIANLNSIKNIAFDAILPNISKGPDTPPFNLTASEHVHAHRSGDRWPREAPLTVRTFPGEKRTRPLTSFARRLAGTVDGGVRLTTPDVLESARRAVPVLRSFLSPVRDRSTYSPRSRSCGDT